MFSNNDKISLRQFQILLILDVFGTGVIRLPAIAAGHAGQDAWITVLISAVIAVVMTLVMTTLGRMFPEESFLSYCSRVVSRPVAVLVCVFFALKIIAGVTLELRLFSEIISSLILPDTPVWVISFSMLLLGAYIALKGCENIARASEILIFAVFVPLIIVIAIMAKGVDYTNILPAFTTQIRALSKGGAAGASSFTGIENCLLIAPFLGNIRKYRRGSVLSVAIIGLCFAAVTVFSVLQFGYARTSGLMFPVLDLMDTIVMPGSFIERQEALIITFFIVSVFSVVSVGVFFSNSLIKDVVKAKGNMISTAAIAAGIMLASFYPADLTDVIRYKQLLFDYLGWAYMLIIPTVLLVIAKIRKLGVNVERNIP